MPLSLWWSFETLFWKWVENFINYTLIGNSSARFHFLTLHFFVQAYLLWFLLLLSLSFHFESFFRIDWFLFHFFSRTGYLNINEKNTFNSKKSSFNLAFSLSNSLNFLVKTSTSLSNSASINLLVSSILAQILVFYMKLNTFEICEFFSQLCKLFIGFFVKLLKMAHYNINIAKNI